MWTGQGSCTWQWLDTVVNVHSISQSSPVFVCVVVFFKVVCPLSSIICAGSRMGTVLGPASHYSKPKVPSNWKSLNGSCRCVVDVWSLLHWIGGARSTALSMTTIRGVTRAKMGLEVGLCSCFRY